MHSTLSLNAMETRKSWKKSDGLFIVLYFLKLRDEGCHKVKTFPDSYQVQNREEPIKDVLRLKRKKESNCDIGSLLGE